MLRLWLGLECFSPKKVETCKYAILRLGLGLVLGIGLWRVSCNFLSFALKIEVLNGAQFWFNKHDLRTLSVVYFIFHNSIDTFLPKNLF